MKNLFHILCDAPLGAWVFTTVLAFFNFCGVLWLSLRWNEIPIGTGTVLRLILLFAGFLFTLIMSIRTYRKEKRCN